MNTQTEFSRRDFLAASSLAAAALGLDPRVLAADSPAPRFPIIGFSKPFQNLGPEETADVVAEIGWNGIECPVRAKGQIEPARVEEDLPKMVEALRRRNLELSVLTTDVEDAVNPLSLKVLRTASRLGLKRYRLKSLNYRLDKPLPPQLDEFRAKLRDLAQLNRELGLHGGLQNHSGNRMIGAPVWDIWYLVKDFDPQHLGVCFDIGHATLEGGLSWPIHAKLMEPYYTAVYVKDFYWKKVQQNWRAQWCPLGEGMVHRAFFDTLKKSPYAGPIAQHHEYELGDRKQMVAAMQKDLRVLKAWLGA
jgi:sugar phosphate isomerase/epimerase